MQQRRGTAQQWTDADPILAAGEIGFETDTNQFKIGDGVNAWSDLSYFKNLEDLGGSLDDYVLVSSKGQINGVAQLDGTGKIPSSQIPDLVGLDSEISSAVSTAVANLVDGAPAALNTLNEIATLIGDGSSIAGTLISNIAELDTNVNTLGQDIIAVEGDVTTLTGTVSTNSTDINELEADLGTHVSDTTNVHGILNTADLATESYADDKASEAQTNAEANAATTADSKISTHNSDTTDVHGIANTALLATTSGVSTAVSDHNALTQNVHGIADTAALATKAYADTAEADAITAAGTAADTKISTAVAALTKSSVGLANVDNTSDANKPVSTATQTALDAKASLAGATFTGDVTVETNFTVDGNLTVSGTTTTVNTTNFTTSDPLIYLGEGNNANLVDLGFVGSYNDGTYAHQGLAKDSSDGKWKLFKGVTDEPTTTINFTQGSLDALKVGAFEATTVTPSSGVVFTDGTQAKEGVPSRTPIIQKTASYTLSALTERDSMIEVGSSSATTVTIPAESAVNYPVGTSIDILQTSTGQVTIAGAAGVTVNATPGLKLRTQWSSATLFKRSADTWVVYGDLMA